jgi:hypothetical protein
MFSRLEMHLRRVAFEHGRKMVMSYRGELVLLEFVPRADLGVETELWTLGSDRSECGLTPQRTKWFIDGTVAGWLRATDRRC